MRRTVVEHEVRRKFPAPWVSIRPRQDVDFLPRDPTDLSGRSPRAWWRRACGSSTTAICSSASRISRSVVVRGGERRDESPKSQLATRGWFGESSNIILASPRCLTFRRQVVVRGKNKTTQGPAPASASATTRDAGRWGHPVGAMGQPRGMLVRKTGISWIRPSVICTLFSSF